MKITKVLNNNVISSFDNQGKEIIIMGKGIGFQKRTGDIVEEGKVEKYFTMPNETVSQFQKLVQEMPYEQVKVADEIISYAKKQLHTKLNKNIYITLTDHLNFAIERQQNGITFHNSLIWEIKKFYREEYEIGKRAIEIIKERLGVELTNDEAGFFALHIVNAEMNGKMGQAMAAPEMIKDVLNIVKYSFQIELDEESLSYERFITHLKFFIQRAVRKEFYQTDDMDIYASIIEKFPEAYRCANQIKSYMEQKLDYEVTEEEVAYLTIHITRIIRRN